MLTLQAQGTMKPTHLPLEMVCQFNPGEETVQASLSLLGETNREPSSSLRNISEYTFLDNNHFLELYGS